MLPLLLIATMPLPQNTDAALAEPEVDFEPAQVAHAAEVIGLAFTDEEIRLMLADLSENVRAYEAMQARPLPNSVPPALGFAPLGTPSTGPSAPHVLDYPEAHRPVDLEDLAFADIATLASLIRAREVSCVELTTMYLSRLRRLDASLRCVVTLTEERALAQARALDRELAEGTWRGPLHGIPWGAKDLLAVGGYPTTWGAATHREQVLDADAEVVRRLDDAGAVLIAKLSLGALAWGDVWFGGKTRNPWNPEQGSSGSSAGSASATAAGGVAFAIGSETLGSIVSPADRCGASALRPTFGRVPTEGAMALSWTMDKLGPICRSVQDAEIVLRVVGDGVRALPADTPERTWIEGRRLGYLAEGFEGDLAERFGHVLDELRGLGVELVPIELPDHPVREMTVLLHAEAACAFDELTRSDRDDELTRQERFAWPNVFRHSRLIPAVEYIRANRLRTLLMRDMEEVMATVDAYVHPSFTGRSLTLTNLTGHPTVVAPCGFREDGTPYSISFTGRVHGDEELLAIAGAWQRATDFHERHPDL